MTKLGNLDKDIGEQLAHYRDVMRNLHGRRMLSQKLIAARIGISPGSLRDWEIGRSLPTNLDHWQQWARALGGRLTITLELPEVK